MNSMCHIDASTEENLNWTVKDKIEESVDQIQNETKQEQL